MSPSVSAVLLAVGGLLHCGLPSATASYTELFSRFDLKQRIAYRIGQVECLKTLQSEGTQYGLGALHRGDYNTDITRFSIKQRIAFLHGQVQCLKIHLNLEEKKVYLDCKDAYQNGHTTSGLYNINPDNQTTFKVYCDMDTKGGGWTVIQRRFDGSVSFDRTWSECERGFGNKAAEYWLGLNYIHRLTASAGQLLRVDLEDFENNTAYAQYTTFTVANATDKYLLRVSGYSGTAGNGMQFNSGRQFTTKDSDNDSRNGNCALYYEGPWWHWNCTFANLNGKYYKSRRSDSHGMTWYPWNGWWSLKKASMKIRRK